MSRVHFDVLVVGGGPVGWACALAARQGLGATARVGVLERSALPPEAPTDAPPAARVYTVAVGNLRALAEAGVRIRDERAAEVTAMRVFGRDGAVALDVSADDGGDDILARVIEHDALTHAIARAAMAQGVTLRIGVATELHDGEGAARKLVELADRTLLDARVVLIADGAGSTLRAAAGLDARHHAYPQCGVVANFALREAHRGTAHQWFLADGSILALLPLPEVRGEPAVSMVWSCPPTQAQALCAMSDAALVAAVRAASADALSLCAVVGGARSFPLQLLRLPDPVGARVLAVGDAAHAMHPLAGQGVNVGLADARTLRDLWRDDAPRVGGDAGHPLLLGRYRRQRYAPTVAMQLATDGLFRLYNATEHPLLMAAGDAGMRLFGQLPAFRRMLLSAAMQ